ncbi:MAG: hypothetical protein RDA78_22750 [Roseibium sp.]|uniref:hypothetical protein n=1 Tax=Roseibium sp. TaxID=1936156 RepID=UPI003D9C09D9
MAISNAFFFRNAGDETDAFHFSSSEDAASVPQSRGNNVFGFEDLPNHVFDEDDKVPPPVLIPSEPPVPPQGPGPSVDVDTNDFDFSGAQQNGATVGDLLF